MSVVFVLLPSLLSSAILVVAELPLPDALPNTSASGRAVENILSIVTDERCSVFFLTDRTFSATSVTMLVDQLGFPGSVGVFEVPVDSQDANVTQAELSRVVDEARRLRQVSWCVTVVVVSDDPAFLASFAQWSLKGRLLVWSTRLLAVTSLPLPKLQHLHESFSTMNAMIIVGELPSFLRCNVYLYLPYSSSEVQPLEVAFWTPHQGLSLTTHLSLFPDKFNRLFERPTLVATTEGTPNNVMTTLEDPEVPGGKKFIFKGPIPDLVDYLAEAVNFSYEYVRPPDQAWGFKHADGTWTGMVGMVMRGEADIGVGLFGVSATRAEVIDFTEPVLIDYWKIMGGRGLPEVDPWGFLLPLATLVWTSVLTALTVVSVSTWLLSSLFTVNIYKQKNKFDDAFTFIRVMLQQNISLLDVWWWKRVVLGVWMLMTLVLTRSYAGNLMSLLAVRHIPQPFQSLQDVVDDSSVITIWEAESASVQYLHSVKSGIFREVANLEKEGRIYYTSLPKFGEVADTLVRRGDHVLIEVQMSIEAIISQDFARTGECSFYRSREEFLPLMFAMIGPKDHPIVPALSKRIASVREAGLYMQWMKAHEPNATYCSHAPSKITVKTTLSLRNVWGMFVVFFGGHVISLLVLLVELLTSHFSRSWNH